MGECSGRLFISHSSADHELVEELASHLQQLGISCWIAPRDIPPGADWTSSIIKAIEDAGQFLILATDDSFRSEQVRRETEKAADASLRILTVTLHRRTVPDWLRYYTSAENMLSFPEHETDPAEVALRIMLLLQNVDSFTYRHFGKTRSFRPFEATAAGETRPVYAFAMSLPPNCPLHQQAETVYDALRVCRTFSGEELHTTQRGALFYFDSLRTGNAAENLCACVREISSLLSGRFHSGWGIGLSSGMISFSDPIELLREGSGTFRTAMSLAAAGGCRTLADCELRQRLGHLCSFISRDDGSYVVRSGKTYERFRGPMVRRKELEIILLKAGNLRNDESPGLGSSGHCVLGVHGERGAGKSVLIHELVRSLEKTGGFRVLRGDPARSDWSFNRIWQGVCESLPGFKPSLPKVKELPQQRAGMFRAISKAAVTNSLVVVLEDIDRSDTAGLQTFRELLLVERFPFPMLFVLSYCKPPDNETSAFLSRFDTHEIVLEPLTREQAKSMTAGIGAIDEASIDLLLRLSGGNPLVLREMVTHSLRSGVLIEQGETWAMTGEPVSLPPSVEAIAYQQLAQLGPITRELLRKAVLRETLSQEEDLELRRMAAAGTPEMVLSDHGWGLSARYLEKALLSTVNPREHTDR